MIYLREPLASAAGLTGVLASPEDVGVAAPLLVCVHGGGCNGAYFEVGPHSTLAAATRLCWPVLLVDRPGFGRSAPPATGEPIEEAAALLPGLVTTAFGTAGKRPVVMIGHSIGAAVALTAAARHRDWPLGAVAVSGIGEAPTPEAAAWFAPIGRGTAGPEPPASFFFGPDGSYGWQGPTALRKAAEPWRRDEVVEVMRGWPARFAKVAGAVQIPVHFRLAEYEAIWQADAFSLERIRRAFRTAICDVGILPGGGHLYEYHKMGGRLVAAQLDFLAERARHLAGLGAATACFPGVS